MITTGTTSAGVVGFINFLFNCSSYLIALIFAVGSTLNFYFLNPFFCLPAFMTSDFLK
ncbi:hypothetical protein Echvi_0438 [Echinicola vietnamensis DSM 17526]|uniref:Uncharacterized protein n=1 Tax=Echinicola vietnamensis (strain DSM 17526 / LMG 23754 / KMM 6221) TaxID=926556 RepID=L0FS07_ECHVK|nr:hypothetical protein Echvi_0438 [Echinicola vietnamensis DSM 17526]